MHPHWLTGAALRYLLFFSACIGVLSTLVACQSAPRNAPPRTEASWVATWTANPQPTWEQTFALPTRTPESVTNMSVRQIVRISLGGSRASFVFSNAYGREPLKIGGATVALASRGAKVVAGSSRVLRFGGERSVTVPPGTRILSDPISFEAKDLSRLAITIHLPEKTELSTFHWDGLETAYFTDGDATQAESFEATWTTPARHFLSRVLVETPNNGAIAVLGDSITDGNGSTPGSDTRWPDHLAERMAKHDIAVVNAGISGNRLLVDKMGESGLARFDTDIISLPRIRGVIVLLGINDIGWPGSTFAPDHPLPSFEELTLAYRQLAARAALNGIISIAATLPPFEDALSESPIDGYYNESKDELRNQVNHWMRSTRWFDHVLDVDKALRDPEHPSRMATHFDSGDHLHPGDLGAKRIAEEVNMQWFTTD